MNLEAKIHIKLHWDGRRICRAELQPRPLVRATELVRGKPAGQAAVVIPMLFSICGKAQGAAAAVALAFAQGGEPAHAAKWERLVLAEALQELLWRFLLDLPKAMGGQGNAALLASLRKSLAQAAAGQDEATWQTFAVQAETALSQAILAMPVADWRKLTDLEQLSEWLHRADTETASNLLELWNGAGRWGDGGAVLMPAASRERILNEVLPGLESDENFAQRPHWQGRVMETGSPARLQTHPVLVQLLRQEGVSILVRFLARLFEIVELLDWLREPATKPHWVQGAALGQGIGLAWVQTARGLLLHRAELDGQGDVVDYRIVAPTEWNFHPAGACVKALTGKPATSADEARRGAELLVQALDPCVAYTIEVEHA
ncbi:hydrogenase expression/formation protein HupK [Sulfuricella denitrificans skB26]|uniref:Hydrogenase expression/formation protein HupK n=1 Tax=Sulfuricella denitrificans (strain DSM 22764 / NBRC 105220 / skB26) TaxID=1163617 RepID=S6AJ79_SULDS|nr:hypothetical protein [Sulfuricella denitrificans]BAN34609.1 hydrogenase expression/formation protein HupK [Sulfuricella denitrificans skB26]